MDVNDDSDEVVDEFDVFLNQDFSDKLYALQYSSIDAGRMFASDQRLVARVKPQNKKLEMDIMLDVSSPNYDQSKGEQIAINVDGGGAADNVSYENSVMDYVVLSSRCISQKGKQYVAAMIQDGQVYLNPIAEVLQLRPNFKYLDQAEKKAANSAKMKAQAESGNSSQDEVEDAKAVTVRIKGVENEAARASREQSATYYEKRLMQERWIPAAVHVKDNYSKKERNRLFGKQSFDWMDEGTDTPDIQISSDTYLNTLVPSFMADDVDSETNPDNFLSISKLKTLPLGEQLKLLMKNAKIIHFSHLLTMLPCNPDANSVVRSLQSYAVLVKGCWIVKSDVLYPADTLSPVSGTPSDIICKARDFILCLFTKQDYLVRSVITKQVGIPWEEVKSILEDVAKMKVGHGWTLKLPADRQFLSQFPEVHERQLMVWESRHKQLAKRFVAPDPVEAVSKKVSASDKLTKKTLKSPNRSRKKSGNRKSSQNPVKIKAEMTEKELNGLSNFLSPPRSNSGTDSNVIVEHAVADINEENAIHLSYNESLLSNSELPMPFVKPSSVGIKIELENNSESKLFDSNSSVDIKMEVDDHLSCFSKDELTINMDNVHATVALVNDQMRQQALNNSDIFNGTKHSS